VCKEPPVDLQDVLEVSNQTTEKKVDQFVMMLMRTSFAIVLPRWDWSVIVRCFLFLHLYDDEYQVLLVAC